MTKKQREKFRKKLPTNYVQLVFQKLVSDGVTCTYSTLYDVIRGKNKNTSLTIKVWEKMAEVKKEHQYLLSKMKKAKSI
jgi:hypothetical protein